MFFYSRHDLGRFYQFSFSLPHLAAMSRIALRHGDLGSGSFVLPSAKQRE